MVSFSFVGQYELVWMGLGLSMIASWKKSVVSLKTQTLALYYALRDPRVSWYAKVWVALVVAYALNPLDLVPDFIPILGYLDDLVLVPLGIALALKMIPPEVMAECRAKAADRMSVNMPMANVMTFVIVLLWIAVLAWAGWTGYKLLAINKGS